MAMTEFEVREDILRQNECWRFKGGSSRTSIQIKARGENQKRYLANISNHPLVFGVGPAGTGKTFLAVAKGMAYLERGQVSKLILTRPAVTAGEELGFLPGSADEKLAPYLRPLLDAIQEISSCPVSAMFANDSVEIAPIAYMRGRTLRNAFVILDEAQNTTREQMKMMLTRFGENSKYVITGDVTQSDLDAGDNGLVHALNALEGVAGVAISRFKLADVVRHPLVGRIISAYDAYELEEKNT
jgi:phosphate starvation-inducible PhoH-like protein